MSNNYSTPEQPFRHAVAAELIDTRQPIYRLARYNAQRGLAAGPNVLQAVAQRKLPMFRLVEQAIQSPETPLLTESPVALAPTPAPQPELTAQTADQQALLNNIRAQVENIHNENRAA